MAAEKLYLVRGSAAGLLDDRPIEEQVKAPRGRYRGLLEPGTDGGPGKTVYWTKKQQELVLPESALKECQQDPEILVVVLREVSPEEAAQIAAGAVQAAESEQLAGVSVEALQAELLRRKGRKPESRAGA